jgi:hypothetical protein
MKALLTIAAAAAATVLALAAGPVPARASDGFHRPSVFPQPADPWRHWGHPRFHKRFDRSRTVIISPRAPGAESHPGAVIIRQRQPVWVQGFWAWNGFGWVWVPGHWIW